MDWSELDGKVAIRCKMSFTQNSPIFDYSREHNIFSPIIMRWINGSVFLTMLIENGMALSNVDKFFLRKFDSSGENDLWYVRFPLKSLAGSEIIEKINEMHSVIMGFLYLKDGKFFVDFRFHKSKYNDISNLLMKSIERDEGIVIESLLPCSGEISYLTEMNVQTPLSLVTFSIPLYDDPIEKCLSTYGGIAQVEKKAGTKYRALLYLKNSPNENDYLTAIADDDLIYEAEGNNPILQEIRKIGNDQVIFRASNLLRVAQKKLKVSVFIPSFQTEKFLKILTRIRIEMKEDVFLYNVQPFNPDLLGGI